VKLSIILELHAKTPRILRLERQRSTAQRRPLSMRSRACPGEVCEPVVHKPERFRSSVMMHPRPQVLKSIACGARRSRHTAWPMCPRASARRAGRSTSSGRAVRRASWPGAAGTQARVSSIVREAAEDELVPRRALKSIELIVSTRRVSRSARGAARPRPNPAVASSRPSAVPSPSPCRSVAVPLDADAGGDVGPRCSRTLWKRTVAAALLVSKLVRVAAFLSRSPALLGSLPSRRARARPPRSPQRLQN